MLALATGESVRGVAGSATAITYTLTGDEKGVSDAFKVLAQGQLPAAAAAIYTVPASTVSLVSQIYLANTTAGALTVTLYINGVAASNQIVRLSVPANGSVTGDRSGWRTYDSTGAVVSTSPLVLTGAVTGSGSGTIATTLAADVVTNTELANMAQATFKMRAAAAGTGDPIDGTAAQAKTALAIANTDVSGLGTLSTQSGTFSGTHSGSSSGTNTGDQTITLTGPVTGTGTGSFATAVTADAITNTELGNMAAATFKMRALGAGTGDPIDGTPTQAKTALAIANTDVSGLGTLSTQSGTFSGTHSGTSSGSNTGDQTITLTGNVTGSGTGSFAATIGAAQVTQAMQTNVAANTITGEFTGTAAAPQSLALAVNTFPARASTGNVAAKAVSDAGLAWLAYNTVALETAALNAATTSAQGMMSAADKIKLDNIWVDVTSNPLGTYNTSQTAAQNITGINAIMAAAPNGSTLFFPPNANPYLNNAAWTFPNKMFSFLGRGSNRAGSPATAFTEIRWNANVAASLLVLPGSGNGWYTTFRNLTFTTTVDQTVGTLFDANGNVGTNFDECAFQSAGGFFLDVLTFGGGAGSNSGNSASINGCNIQGFKGNGVLVNSAGSSLTLTDSVVQGQWGTTAQAATACIRAKWVGALQIIGCDILGGTNNILSDPTAASSEVCASLQCTNTYFDSAFGSCIKVSGTGATVRGKFDTCTFTTNTGGTAFAAVELAGSFVYGVGAQDIAFVNCNIYNTFGTTGATNGVLISNVADVSFVNCKVAGWATGYNITPMASNKTNVQIIGGTVGPSGGYAGNTTGFTIGAGAYKGLQIRGNNCVGNTTALTLGAVTVNAGEGALFAITDNAGINPKGSVTTPAYPATTVTVTNTTGFRCMVMQKLAATTTTALTINGVASVVPNVIQTISYTLDPGGTMAIAFTGTAGTWVWHAN